MADYRAYKAENEDDYNMYWRRTEYIDGEDGELSWFNAGVRVGVGIGLGICLGLGIGVGLLSVLTNQLLVTSKDSSFDPFVGTMIQ